MATATLTRNQYRLPLIGRPDPDFERGLKVAGSIGLVVLILALVVPRQNPEIASVDDVPERFAKLILEEPKTPPAPVKLPDAPRVTIEKPPAPVAKPIQTVRPDVGQRRVPKEAVPENRGQAGRERAQKEVQQQLASVTTSLESVLDDVSKSLASTDDGKPARKRTPRRRKTRGGRDAAQLASVGTPMAGVGLADAGSSAIGGSRIEIESGGGELVSESWVPDGAGGSGTASNQSLRTDQSLLAVVRRYAPGIQFCYDNELKKQAGLGGKLVVSITVAAAGNVSGANVVKNTVGSPELVRCAIAQIEAWRFPAIPEGTVTFQAPFVFTPPE